MCMAEATLPKLTPSFETKYSRDDEITKKMKTNRKLLHDMSGRKRNYYSVSYKQARDGSDRLF